MSQFSGAVRFFLVFIFTSLTFATASTYAQENLALNKTVTASSIETASLSAANIVDGITTSRWSSSFSDNQWIAVDLGTSYLISGVKLSWQNSHGREYHIQTSTDG